MFPMPTPLIAQNEAAMLQQLLDVHPRYGPRDHELLDLSGALEDVVDQPEMAL
jgi:hypothetical protein